MKTIQKHTVAARLAFGLFALAVLTLSASPAQSRPKISVDFPDSIGGLNNNGKGEIWPSTDGCGNAVPGVCRLDFSSADVSQEVALGFPIMIAPNPNPFTTVFVDKHGIVSFGGGINATPTATTFGDLQSQVAAPFISSFFSPALVPLDGTSPFVVNGEGGVVVQRGTADPLADVNAAPPYDATRATDAVGIIWFDATNNAETQLIIYRNGTGGDFDFRIRYGAADGDVYNNGSGLTGLAGISFGAGIDTKVMSSPPTLTPLNEVDDYFFNVRSGHLGTGAPIDTDGDGIADSVDNCRLVANSDQLDTDKDGFGDVCDNCPLVANHDQTDTNGNGIGDVCELPTVRRCYVDADNDIDLYDIFAILKATGKHVSATDPRDADGNLIVTFVDAATCAKKCTRRYCAVK